jgi:hypothetical protein
MPIYDIITPDRDLPPNIREAIGENVIYIQTHQDINDLLNGEPTGIFLYLDELTVEIETNREELFSFIINPLNMTLTIMGDVITLRNNIKRRQPMLLFIQETMSPDLTIDDRDIIIEAFKSHIVRLQTQQRMRNLTEVLRVGKNRALPENVENIMASFLSGKKGTINGQVNKLKQNVGYSLAPRTRKNRP